MSMMQHQKKEGLVIIGAGLCGSLLGIRLAQRGYEVHIYESRPDMRFAKIDGGRSINLALSDRGIKALELIGMEYVVERDGIPLFGRMIHPLGIAEASYMPYSGRKGEAIHSISRGGLNMTLLEETEKYPNIHLYFNQRCVNVDFEQHRVEFQDSLTRERYELECNLIFATDGAGSAVRRAMMRHSNEKRFNFSQDFLTHGYKELSIPAAESGGFRIEKNALHIWPRGSQMLIALPNLDGSFTVTLFQDFEGPDGFNALNTPEKINDFFDRYYPSAKAQMPDLVNDFIANPSANLGTVKCFPWQFNHYSLLLGDAAHAIVPFYGQGMNCAFEDVCILENLMDEHGENWASIFDSFQDIRKPDGDAIADLAVDNFYEMRISTTSVLFQRKKALETKMEQAGLPYFSKYALVTFRPDLRYSDALIRGRLQDEYLLEYCKTITDINQVDLISLQAEIESYIDSALEKSEIY